MFCFALCIIYFAPEFFFKKITPSHSKMFYLEQLVAKGKQKPNILNGGICVSPVYLEWVHHVRPK